MMDGFIVAWFLYTTTISSLFSNTHHRVVAFTGGVCSSPSKRIHNRNRSSCCTSSNHLPLAFFQTTTSSNESWDDDIDTTAKFVGRPEHQNRMYQYVSDFLKNQSDHDQPQQQAHNQPSNSNNSIPSLNTTFTHCIAIPMADCHELLLELESIQRAILYHCPVLVHSCIPGTLTRLPLLYVNARIDCNSETQHHQQQQTTHQLQQIVQKTIEQIVEYSSTHPRIDKPVTDSSNTTTTTNAEAVVVDDDDDDDNYVNDDGYRPLTVQFQSLEIDSIRRPNQILYTVAQSNTPGTATLQRLVQELQQRIELDLGWYTALPQNINDINNNNNNHHQQQEEEQEWFQQLDCEKNYTSSQAECFRPRIPFMRLPENWDDILRQSLEQNNDPTMDIHPPTTPDLYCLTADQGGNGISPIHWGKWSEDVLGGFQRLREVAIYPRTTTMTAIATSQQPSSMSSCDYVTEQYFPVPTASVLLPDGTVSQNKQEAYFAEYQHQRLLDTERKLLQESNSVSNSKQQPWYDNESNFDDDDDDDWLLVTTKKRLETIYNIDSRDSIDLNEIETKTQPHAEDAITLEDDDTEWKNVQAELTQSPQRNNHPDSMDEWTKKRMQKVFMSRARYQSGIKLAEKKEKPPIENNTVFFEYKNGSLVPAQLEQTSLDTPELPPFPSKEHCIGFWRVLSSPTGFDLEDDDPKCSENLVLRVDGTIAGGPILDQERRQKASGGTWTLTVQNQFDPILQIRMILPPKKDRLLVLEGKLRKTTKPMTVPLARNTFGIPKLERLADNNNAAAKLKGYDSILSCKGSVWIEDRTTQTKSYNIGSFSIMKLNLPDISQLSVTIPRNTRNQD